MTFYIVFMKQLQPPLELSEFGNEIFSHPYYWSAFTLIGNPW
ncbi:MULTISPECIES: hypothetical protein [Okeania]|nr:MULTISPECIES: hypothetical protein [Okeania]